MVSKRQREARKRFRAAHPDLFPKPESKDPNEKKAKKKEKRKKSLFKRKKAQSIRPGAPNATNGPIKRGARKHPLRVPGAKPGEGCFICKATDHIAKLCPQKAEWNKNKICLSCRQRGHDLKNCPNSGEEKICYNCGGNGHSRSKCPQPLQDGGSKFASCFICKERGHLSKECPKNNHGIYPKGGCCKVCGGVTHLAKDCPNKGHKSSFDSEGTVPENERRPQVTKFASGDDLDDDFAADDKSGVHNDTKQKKGPKVVIFQ